MARTVDDYDSMAKREMIKAKQEKAMMCVYGPVKQCMDLTLSVLCLCCTRRVQKFRSDYAELRAQFEAIKAEVRTMCNRLAGI